MLTSRSGNPCNRGRGYPRPSQGTSVRQTGSTSANDSGSNSRVNPQRVLVRVSRTRRLCNAYVYFRPLHARWITAPSSIQIPPNLPQAALQTLIATRAPTRIQKKTTPGPNGFPFWPATHFAARAATPAAVSVKVTREATISRLGRNGPTLATEVHGARVAKEYGAA